MKIYSSSQTTKPVFLTIEEVTKLTRLSISTLWRLEKSNTFPKRHKISPRRIGWPEQEIFKWMRSV